MADTIRVTAFVCWDPVLSVIFDQLTASLLREINMSEDLRSTPRFGP